MSTPDFHWNEIAHCVVQQAAEQVAIYSNPAGDVVVRQARAWDEQEDPFIVISRANAVAAAYAILEAARLPMEIVEITDHGYCDVERPSRPSADNSGQHDAEHPKDRTAAERMRRYRNKQRNGNRNADRNALTEEAQARLVAAE